MVAKMEQLQVLFNTCAPWVVLWMYAANPGKLIPQHMVLNRAAAQDWRLELQG